MMPCALGYEAAFENAFKSTYEGLCDVPYDFLNLLGDCSSPPDPHRLFRECIGFAVASDEQAVVAPAGDTNSDENPLYYLPASLDPCSVTVGGMRLDGTDQLAKWPFTQEGPYVDVAGFAEDVVGLSGQGADQYNTSFGGTAAAASIGAGVASLLRAENGALSGEDVDHILEATAYDVGVQGRDDATGAGAIDAGAALAFVRTKDVQRDRRTVADVYRYRVVEESVKLYGSEYVNEKPYTCGGVRAIYADLHEFKARINFNNTFSGVPEAWGRQGQSEGIDSRRGIDGNEDMASYYDPLTKGLETISVNERGISVKGYYWDATYYDLRGSECGSARLPDSPGDFQIAYTAIGTEGALPPPPPAASITGPNQSQYGQRGNWTANASGGTGSYSYSWSVRRDGTWHSLNETSANLSHAFHESTPSAGRETRTLRVVVSDGEDTATATHLVSVYPSGCGGRFICQKLAEEEALPEEFALTGSYPNPTTNRAEISYALPEAAYVEFSVYDALAREVARLVERERPAGYRTATFEAQDLPSGVYVYRLRAGEAFAESGTLVLVK